MSALGYSQIVSYLTRGNEDERLVVTPLLDPALQVSSNQAAIDVRLGRVFSLVRPWAHGVAELAQEAATPKPTLEPIVLPFGKPFIIHPHQFVLARTLEMVRLPRNLLAYVIGRSSWGRRGLIVATAVVVHPGFAGSITLELRNLGEMPVALYPMDRIAQLTFHETDKQVAPAMSSQFRATFEPSLGRVRDATTEERIRRLAESTADESAPGDGD
jgi:dCTP deaminase